MQVTEFSAHMRAMKVHYKGFPLTRYPLPISCVEKRLMSSFAADFNADYKDAIEDNKQNIHNFVEGQQQVISQEIEKLGKNPTGTQTDDFKKKLTQQKEKAKAEADKRIEQIFGKLEAVGTAHPESQQEILSGTEKLISFFSDLLGKLIDFVSDLVQRIYEYLKDAVNKVGSFFKEAYNSVSSFFSSVFLQLRSTSLESGVLSEESKGDNFFKWDKKNALMHSQSIIKFAESQKLSISVEDSEEVKQWQSSLPDKSLLEEGVENLDREITLSLIASTVKIVGIAALSGLVAYAISRGYRVSVSIAESSVKFAFEPSSRSYA